mmetsp:Transcript_23143/g.35105  ORF Transcript_23143/g.35105 Transcript_23143/m.35105 type:complete len:214 (+) Transcript_23143:63-704(+)
MMSTMIVPIVLLLLSSSTDAFAPPTPPIIIQEVIASNNPGVLTISRFVSLSSEWTTLALSSSSLTIADKAATAKVSTATASTNIAKSAPTKASGIIISDLQYDGKVPKTEADEYVVITNASQKKSTDISNYVVYVATSGTQGATFTFPQYILKPGQNVRIYTNEIHKESGGFSFGSGKAIWNNKGGLAVLKDAKGDKLNEYKYQGGGAETSKS